MSFILQKAKKSSIWLTCPNLCSSLKMSKQLLSSRQSAPVLLQVPMAAKKLTILAQPNTDKFTTKAIKNITRKAREAEIAHKLDTAINEIKTIIIMLDRPEEIRHKRTSKEEDVKIINAAKIIRTPIKRAKKTIKITIKLKVMKRAKETKLRCDMCKSSPRASNIKRVDRAIITKISHSIKHQLKTISLNT